MSPSGTSQISQTDKIALSVIICTHNPREDYLRRTLEGLRTQSLPVDWWELLLIDNASTVPLADRWDLSWHPRAGHIREEKLGLAHARVCAIAEAQGDLLVFVDDDNILAGDYLERVESIAKSHGVLGCFGAGVIEPEFERQPHPDVLPFTESLALRTTPVDRWTNIPEDFWYPYGAGLVVRKDVANQHTKELMKQSEDLLLGRKGGALNACEDDDYSWTACAMGYGRGIFASLRITHLIDQRRVEPDYLLKIIEGYSYSVTLLRSKHGQPFPPPDPVFSLSRLIRSAVCLKWHQALTERRKWKVERHRSAFRRQRDRALIAGYWRAVNHLRSAGPTGSNAL